MTPPRIAVVSAVGLCLALAFAVDRVARRSTRLRLPSRITIENVVADLSGTLDRSAVVAEPSDAPVRAGELEPNPYYKLHGGRRPALLAPPPSRIRHRLRLPADAALELSTGVQGPATRDTRLAGIRFSVSIDGEEVFARTIDPAASHRDRRWFDDRVELGRLADREVELTLSTDVAVPARRPSGIPGWSHVRVLHQTHRDRQPARPDAPNVLLLLVDTLRADQLGCYGAAPSPSPSLDRLARQGLVFESAIAQAPWTVPSVASIFTGLHPTSHGLTGDRVQASFLADTLPTLAAHAEQGGITTIGVSANFVVSRETNLARGFETFIALPENRDSREEARASDVNGVFLDWLHQNPGRRFLAYLHYMEPHEPYDPPAALRPVPPEGIAPAVARGHVKDLMLAINHGRHAPLGPAAVGHLRALYQAEVRTWDTALGGLLEGLAAAGVRESTVILVTADHGEEFQEHGRLGHGTQLYDELLRVPLVIAGPGIVPGRVAEQAQGIDVFPTVSALLGLPPPPGLEGQNLLAARAARPAISETRNAIGPDGTEIRLLSLRTPEWKLIHAPALGRSELYDLAHDPGEHDDRFGAVPQGAALRETLAAWESAAPSPPVMTYYDPAFPEKLRALGYVE